MSNKNPYIWLLAGIGVTILLGTLLLALPCMYVSGEWASPVNALFMATSATCVTGLSVVELGSDLTLAGQLVVLLLVQIGGLGILTFSTFFMVLMGRRLTINDEKLASTVLGGARNRGLRSIISTAIVFTLSAEILLGAILSVIHWKSGLPPTKSIYYGIFHAVCSFCNSGFSLYSENLTAMRSSPLYLATSALLMILGGIGFLVVLNIARAIRSSGRLSLHTRLVILTTLTLIVLGTTSFILIEWRGALGEFGALEKIGIGLFHSISARTAGFNVLPMEEISAPSKFLTSILMFIGGSPGSTAGGIKTTTFAVLFLTMLAILRRRKATCFGNRTIPEGVVREALAVGLLAAFFLATIYWLLLCTNATLNEPLDLFFETASAFSTSGLSVIGDIAARITPPGRFLLILAMIVGRLGPLTIALTVAASYDRNHIKYPEESVIVG